MSAITKLRGMRARARPFAAAFVIIGSVKLAVLPSSVWQCEHVAPSSGGEWHLPEWVGVVSRYRRWPFKT